MARRHEAVGTEVERDLVLLDPRSGVYFGLERVGRRIWELLDEPRSVADLCSALEKEFEVSPEACRTDVLTFLERLLAADLLEIR